MCGSDAPAWRRSLTISCTYAHCSWKRIRSRHACIAVATCSTGSSASESTGCGPLMITSCAPVAGSEVNSSVRAAPRAPSRGSEFAAPAELLTPPGAASGASSSRAAPSSAGASAGYRLGTTRTVQPGELGTPPPGLTAYSSGGVRSSWPSANGSRSGSIGSGARSASVSVGAPPGRRERSPATIVRCPLSGSMRISGMRPRPRRNRVLRHAPIPARSA